VIIDKSLVINN